MQSALKGQSGSPTEKRTSAHSEKLKMLRDEAAAIRGKLERREISVEQASIQLAQLKRRNRHWSDLLFSN